MTSVRPGVVAGAAGLALLLAGAGCLALALGLLAPGSAALGLLAPGSAALGLLAPGSAALGPLDRWFLSALAAALAVAGGAALRGALGFGLLAGLFLLGGTAQLHLTEPLWFPALRLRPEGWRDLAMLGLIGLEALVAAAVLWRRGPAWLLRQAGQRLGWGRIGLFLALSAGLSVSVMGFIPQAAWSGWAVRLVAGGGLVAVHLAMLVALAQVRPPAGLAAPLSPLIPAALAVVASLGLSLFAFERMPHVEDEFVYLFQARTFAGGAASVPAPPAAAMPGLDYYLLQVEGGRWFAVTAPGWPLVLAAGVLVGMPWLVGPLLAGASVLLAFAIARDRLGAQAAALVALMLATSPWFLAAAASLMTHSLTITLMLFAWWAVLRPGRGRALSWALAAGLAMGWVFTVRPLDGLLIGGLTGIWVLAQRPGGLVRAALYGLGCLATGSVYFLHNLVFTGSLLTSPLQAYLRAEWGPGANAFGFGPGIGPKGNWGALDLEPGHSLYEGLVNTANNLAGLQLEFMGWGVGSLALVLAFLIWQRPRGLDRVFDWAMLGVVLAVISALMVYWFAGSFYIGPRYWFMMVFPLVYLSVRGLQGLEARLGGGASGSLTPVLVVLCLSSLLIFAPWRGVAKYYRYQGYHAVIRDDLASGRFGNAVVLVSDHGNIASALVLNDPWLGAAAPVFLADIPGTDEAALRAAFPGREIMHYAPDWQRAKE